MLTDKICLIHDGIICYNIYSNCSFFLLLANLPFLTCCDSYSRMYIICLFFFFLFLSLSLSSFLFISYFIFFLLLEAKAVSQGPSLTGKRKAKKESIDLKQQCQVFIFHFFFFLTEFNLSVMMSSQLDQCAEKSTSEIRSSSQISQLDFRAYN